MKPFRLITSLSLLALPALAQVTNTGTYTQNFDTLATTGTALSWANNVTLTGWYAYTTGNNRYLTAYGGVSGHTGIDFASYGSAGDSERGLGSSFNLTNGPLHFGVGLVNGTTASVTSIDISFWGEQWGRGGSGFPTYTDSLTFSYQIFNTSALSSKYFKY